jgi:hypothetical protein
MSTFLISKNNLCDLVDVQKARNNLGIGTLAIQDSNDVNITGGSISVSNIILHKNNVLKMSFVVSLDDKGTLGYFKPDIKDWINLSQDEIDISSFSNDLGYLRNNDLVDVAFTGDYNDLINTPCNLNDFFDESSYLIKENNLSDVDDIEAVKSNLGFGPFASFKTNESITISNLYILNDFHFIPDRGNVDDYIDKYMKLTKFDKIEGTMTTEWVDLPIAGQNDNLYGLLQISSNYLSDDPYTAPSSKALYEAYDELNSKIANTSDQQFMIDLIDNHGLLTKQKNLSEFSPFIDEVKSNLNIGSLAEQNSDDVIISNLTITQLNYSQVPISGYFLKCRDETGRAEWRPLPRADDKQLGAVYIASDIDNVSIENEDTTTLNIHAINEIYNDMLASIETLSNNVPTKIRDLEDWRDFCIIDDAFKNINANKAKTNLGLAKVSWTGKYTDLTNLPQKLSSFCNNVFLTRDNNLSELSNDSDNVIHNLGLGDMCKQNSNDVNIRNGIANFSSLKITNDFTFDNVPNDIDTHNQMYYLAAANQGGKVEWKKINEATEELYGVVQLTHDISNEESLTKVASATAVFKAFNEVLTRIKIIGERIDRITKK